MAFIQTQDTFVSQAQKRQLSEHMEEVTPMAVRDTSIATARMSITGFNYIMNGGYKRRPDNPNFNLHSEESKAITNLLPNSELHKIDFKDIKSKDQLAYAVKSINTMNEAGALLHDNLGTAGTFAAVALTSALDPLTYVGGLGFYKLNKAAKLVDTLAGVKQASLYGSQAAVVESVSAYEIEAHGSKDWINVPISAAAAFTLVGGISHAAVSLERAALREKTRLSEEYIEQGLSVKDDMDSIKEGGLEAPSIEAIDAIENVSKITPVKNWAVKALDALTGGKSAVISSSLRVLGNRGGEAARQASKHDLLPFQLKDGDGNIIATRELDGMTAKYEMKEDLMRSIGEQKKALDDFNAKSDTPVSDLEFDTMVTKSYRDAEIAYRTKKVKIDSEVRAARSDDIHDEIVEDILTEGKAENLSVDEINLRVESDEVALEIETRIQEEVNAKMKEEAEYEFTVGNESVDAAMKARLDYYETINKRMQDSEMEGSRAFDSRFYSPVKYDVEKILQDPKKAVEDFTKAIQESPEHQYKIAQAQAKLDEAKAKLADNKKLEKLEHEFKEQERKIQEQEQLVDDLIRNDEAISEAYMAENIADDVDRMFPIAGERSKAKLPSSSATTLSDELGANLSTKELSEILKDIDDLELLDDMWRMSGRPKIRTADQKGGKYSAYKNTIYLPKKRTEARTLQHEMTHALTVRAYNTDMRFKSEIDSLFNEIVTVAQKGTWTTKPLFNEDYKVLSKYLRDSNDRYGFTNPKEFISEVFSNRKFADVLNNIEYKGDLTNTKPQSFYRRLVQTVLGYLNRGKIKDGSILKKTVEIMEAHSASTQPKIKRSDIHSEMLKDFKVFKKAQRVKEKYMVDKDTDNLNGTQKNAYNRKKKAEAEAYNKYIQQVKVRTQGKTFSKLHELDVQTSKLYDNARNTIEENQKLKIKRTDKAEQSIADASAEFNRVSDLPKLQAKGTIKAMEQRKGSEVDLSVDDDIANGVVGHLKKRTLDTDRRVLDQAGYIRPNIDAMAKYHYLMSGKIATKQSTGFSDLQSYRKHIESLEGLSKDDIGLLSDLFEDVQGTKALSSDPNSFHQLFVRGTGAYNYLTMGGQFTSYGMSEIGVGIMRTGFSYLGALIPAMRETIGMYKGQKLSDIAEASMYMGDATDIIEALNKSRQGDVYSPDELFTSSDATRGQRAVKKMSDWSRTFFRYSGLEGITVLTKQAIPRAMMQRVIKEFQKNPNVVAKDMQRFGFSPDFTAKVMKQPFALDKFGNVTDFNFSKWDTDTALKFKRYMSRAARETIITVDATRLPSWMGSSSENIHVLFKLAKQFMSFSAVAHERLLLAGVNERAAMAAVGATVSAGILGTFQLASQEIAVELGIMPKGNRKFDMETEQGRNKFYEFLLTRQSFSGNIGQMYDFMSEVTNPSKSYSASTKIAGGITAGRMIQMGKAIGEAVDGEFGTHRQASVMKSMIIGNNIIGLDNMNRHIMNTMIEDGYESP